MFCRIGRSPRRQIAAPLEVKAIFRDVFDNSPQAFPLSAALANRPGGVPGLKHRSGSKTLTAAPSPSAPHLLVYPRRATPTTISASPHHPKVLRLGSFIGVIRPRRVTKRGIAAAKFKKNTNAVSGLAVGFESERINGR